MRVSLAAAVAALLSVAAASPAPETGRVHGTSAHSHNSSHNPNVAAGGTVPHGAASIDVNDAGAVRARVRALWAEVEKTKPVEHAAITHVYRNFSDSEWRPLPHSLTTRPYQVDFERDTTNGSTLPADFLWGYASASAQVEGAVKADGRGPSIWDWFAHRTDGMGGGDTFDVATNFRYMYPLDLKRVAAMGAKLYSFSVSWSRVMPLGRGYVSKEGLQFYKDLVTEIHANGMKAAVTLQHWDIPLYLQINENGMQNESYVNAFSEYAAVVLKALGPMGVEHWVSHNEPQTNCGNRYLRALAGVYGYESAPASARWVCSGVTLKAHGAMNELMGRLRKSGTLRPGAALSFKNSGSLNVPFDRASAADRAANERGMEFSLGLFSDPVYSDGHDYPAVVKKEVPAAWLPTLTEQDKARLRDSAQYFASDWYSSAITQALPDDEYKACAGNVSNSAWPNCASSPMTMKDGWPLGTAWPDLSCNWMSNTPGQFRNHLAYVAKRWPAPQGVVVTEIGWPERDEANKTETWDVLQDTGRQKYYAEHLNQIVESVTQDHVNISGAWLWSATPNVEWEVGKLPRFGTSSINYTDPTLPRTYMGSAYVVRDFFKKHLPGK